MNARAISGDEGWAREIRGREEGRCKELTREHF